MLQKAKLVSPQSSKKRPPQEKTEYPDDGAELHEPEVAPEQEELPPTTTERATKNRRSRRAKKPKTEPADVPHKDYSEPQDHKEEDQTEPKPEGETPELEEAMQAEEKKRAMQLQASSCHVWHAYITQP